MTNDVHLIATMDEDGNFVVQRYAPVAQTTALSEIWRKNQSVLKTMLTTRSAWLKGLSS